MTPSSPVPGHVVEIEPGLRRVLAPNPSPMTYWGTNTFLLGTDSLAIIDPGPQDAAHLDALLKAVGSAHVTHIFVTHSHLDHSPLARPLAKETGADILAFGPSAAGRTDVMARLAAEGLAGGGEGVDHAFAPDICVTDGQRIVGDGWDIVVHHTPGHMGNHIALEWKQAVFTGDLVMGWASTMVSPPDGDLACFLKSCTKLSKLNARCFFPAHGDTISDPGARLKWLLAHRLERSQQIRHALNDGPLAIPDLTARIYTDVRPELLPAAARNVFAHLVHLVEKGEVTAQPLVHPDSVYALIGGES